MIPWHFLLPAARFPWLHTVWIIQLSEMEEKQRRERGGRGKGKRDKDGQIEVREEGKEEPSTGGTVKMVSPGGGQRESFHPYF